LSVCRSRMIRPWEER